MCVYPPPTKHTHMLTLSRAEADRAPASVGYPVLRTRSAPPHTPAFPPVSLLHSRWAYANLLFPQDAVSFLGQHWFPTHCCAATITVHTQDASSTGNEPLHPINDSHPPLYPDPGVRYSTSCLCEFNSSKFLRKVESYNICPFVFG